MPKVYRTMFEQGGSPRVGSHSCELGVRPGTDVDVNANGDVRLNGKGMSVFRSLSDLRALPSHLVPKHLWRSVRGAAGLPGLRIWTMGQGVFISGPVTGNLQLHENGGRHGNICPSSVVSIIAFQDELAATQSLWGIDEP
jgi:hypothetical protein